MSEEIFLLFQDGYGYAMIVVRGIFLGLMIQTFFSRAVLDKKKTIILSAVVTVEGLILFALPISTRGKWTYISLITVLAVFFFYNRQYMPHIAFVLLLWTNVFYVWYLMNTVTNDIFGDLIISDISFSFCDRASKDKYIITVDPTVAVNITQQSRLIGRVLIILLIDCSRGLDDADRKDRKNHRQDQDQTDDPLTFSHVISPPNQYETAAPGAKPLSLFN